MPRIGFDGRAGRSGAADGRMWFRVVVVMPPSGAQSPGVGARREDRLVQAFVPKPAVKALDESILLRLARRDVMPGDPTVLVLFEGRRRGQLGAVVTDDRDRPAAPQD